MMTLMSALARRYDVAVLSGCGRIGSSNCNPVLVAVLLANSCRNDNNGHAAGPHCWPYAC